MTLELALSPAAGVVPLTRSDPPPLVPVWYAADAATGAVLDELPLVPSPIARVVGQPMSTSAQLTISGAPSGWIEDTEPGRTMVVCVVDETPIWAGLVIGRARGSAPTAALSLVTPEAYLDRRYASDHTWSAVDECSVVGAGLIGDCAVDGLGLIVDAVASGTLISETYADSNDTSILSALTSLMQTGSPEITIDVAWSDSTMTSFDLIARIRHTLGVHSSTPNAVFELPGCVISYTQTEDYTSGKGATAARAYGNGEGATRATSGDVLSPLIAQGWPRWDHRWTPNQATTDPAVLTAAATQAVAVMGAGTSIWTLDAAASQAPRVGTDWGLGDTVALQVDPSPAGGQIIAPGHPNGVQVNLRALGWSLDFAGNKLTPVLAGS
ncbi:hypothetical protein KGA66_06005 [Actinocrinis puniceicyclus]|uniref:Uncharacterized protein n=1 Tax=Actinocrinis puniceicyclus TaxID=977794 RepID=A0A8J7WM02_9ACTN|nr:hypothetical protein [Actinocrinis puniceicyclus]MBS2962592.1 hypothetical protein [Actinocrinis puniceicyclus]